MKEFSEKLLCWYDQYHRNLPWRIGPADLAMGQKPDPYRVWLSEIMLQQTTVEAVKPYFDKFIKQWPNVFALARSDLEDVLKAWAGLGYYSRARNLKLCAEKLVAEYQGIFPDTPKSLKTLPGIGDYTSAAIAAIAYNKPVAVVDGNVERLISRLFTIKTEVKKAKREITEKTQNMTPHNRAGDFAQSMMDLGATICTVRQPRCMICPVESLCHAKQEGAPDIYPIKAAKVARPERTGAAFVAINSDGELYLEKRHMSGLLGGMTQIPNLFSAENNYSVTDAPFAADWQLKGKARHVFTHFSLVLDVFLARDVEKSAAGNGWWCPLDQLADQVLPTVMKKAISVALPDIFNSKK